MRVYATCKPCRRPPTTRPSFFAKVDKYGVAETGHVADLVLLDANPLQDIHNTRKIFGVVWAEVLFPWSSGQNACTSRDTRRAALSRGAQRVGLL